MRKICLLLLCLLFAGLVHAQSAYFERNYQANFYNDLAEMRSSPSGVLYLFQQENEGQGQQSYGITRIASDGSQIFTPIFSGTKLDFDFLPIEDGYIVIDYVFECDVIIPRSLARFDFTGTRIWDIQLDFLGEHGKLLPGPGDNFWVFREGDVPLLYDLDGNLLESGPSVLPVFKGYKERSNDKLLTYGLTALNQYNKTLNTVQSIDLGEEIVNADTLSDDRTVVLTFQNLYLLGASFDIIKVVAHGLSPYALKDMATDGTRIKVLSGNSSPGVRTYDADLLLTDTQLLPINDPFSPKFMSVHDFRMVLTGNALPSGAASSGQVIGVRAMPLYQPWYAATADARVTNVTMSGQPVAYPAPDYPGGTLKANDVKVTVKNEGNAVLETVTLNAVLSTYNFFCGLIDKPYYKTFNGLQVAPGDSITFEVGTLVGEFAGTPIPTVYPLCFWTTLPNDSLDINPLNDATCKSFNTIVGTKNPETVYPLAVFPNPAAGDFLIQLPLNPTQATVQLIDLTGRAVWQTSGSGFAFSVQVPGLARGIYQVSVRDEQGNRYMGKVAVE
jgi:hypothetical protein